MTKMIPCSCPYWMYPIRDKRREGTLSKLADILYALDICYIIGDRDFEGNFSIWVKL